MAATQEVANTPEMATVSIATAAPTVSDHTLSPIFDSPVRVPTMTDSVGGHATSPLPVPSATPTPSSTSAPAPTPTAQTSVPDYTFRVVNTFLHDPEAFTQGLVFHNGVLYEGTGLRGQSSLRKVELETGTVLQRYDLPAQYFGEGIAILGDRLFQLTWRSRLGFVYDKETFEPLSQFAYSSEGWGLTHDGVRLIMSDGTSTLRFLDPASLQELGQIEVLDGEAPVSMLNELEYVDGEVWANVWKTDRIVRIDPTTGQVVGWIDLSGLLQESDKARHVDVLNGIAYDSDTGRIFVTGKLWPKLFEIQVLDSRVH
jgi:glutamine cyclotransferase